jgi:hypothetical protein
MIARVRAYSADGSTLLGVLPTIDLQFSVEVGGGGTLNADPAVIKDTRSQVD